MEAYFPQYKLAFQSSIFLIWNNFLRLYFFNIE